MKKTLLASYCHHSHVILLLLQAQAADRTAVFFYIELAAKTR